MRRKRIALLLLTLTSLLAMAVVLLVVFPRPRAKTPKNLQKIRGNMTLAEIEAVLGGPPGDYRNDLSVPLNIPRFNSEAADVRWWQTDDFRLTVTFNKDGRADQLALEFFGLPRPPTTFERFLEWLGL